MNSFQSEESQLATEIEKLIMFRESRKLYFDNLFPSDTSRSMVSMLIWEAALQGIYASQRKQYENI